jgi:hypothetical protein
VTLRTLSDDALLLRAQRQARVLSGAKNLGLAILSLMLIGGCCVLPVLRWWGLIGRWAGVGPLVAMGTALAAVALYWCIPVRREIFRRFHPTLGASIAAAKRAMGQDPQLVLAAFLRVRLLPHGGRRWVGAAFAESGDTVATIDARAIGGDWEADPVARVERGAAELTAGTAVPFLASLRAALGLPVPPQGRVLDGVPFSLAVVGRDGAVRRLRGNLAARPEEDTTSLRAWAWQLLQHGGEALGNREAAGWVTQEGRSRVIDL